ASTPASLGDIVVVDVGYNEDAVNYGTDMASLVQALISRGVGHVVWVTLRQKTDNYAKIDAIVESQAKRWPQVQIADWDAASQGRDWFNDDGLHLNAAGAVGLALLLRGFVLADCGAPCQPVTPASGKPPRNTRLPSLRGSAVVGQTISCRKGSW